MGAQREGTGLSLELLRKEEAGGKGGRHAEYGDEIGTALETEEETRSICL